jgi:sulfur carrier protein
MALAQGQAAVRVHVPEGRISAMIEIVLNGAARQFEAALTVIALLEREGLLGKRVAVERNGEIVPKSLHATTPVESGDQLEIVVAVGGG